MSLYYSFYGQESRLCSLAHINPIHYYVSLLLLHYTKLLHYGFHHSHGFPWCLTCTSPVDLCMAQDATSHHGGAETQCHGAATAGVERGRNPGAASATKTVGWRMLKVHELWSPPVYHEGGNMFVWTVSFFTILDWVFLNPEMTWMMWNGCEGIPRSNDGDGHQNVDDLTTKRGS